MKILRFPSLPSTYTYVAQNAASLHDGDLVVTEDQTCGRGQRGNSWESAPGLNLTFTLLSIPQPGWEARRQFLISEATAVAIATVLREQCGIECKVKWPNDIYAFNPASGTWGKICGILISHSLEGAAIRHSVVGAGINVNQTDFLSDAPNPVSIKNILGTDTPLDPLLEKVGTAIETRLRTLFSDPGYAPWLHEEYMSLLWRGDSRSYPWLDAAKGERFSASIFAVEPLGHLVLSLPDGSLRRYAFKEVVFIEPHTYK